ncbi:hypothetical protein Q1695_009938 [Nippostrongylus brasiliensis]|nr:hypothetical protein Q1695_009938 [Nippostrongylus brasiliensis]
MIRLDLRILLLASIVSRIQSISIDNDIVGEPDIECLDEEIRIWVKTRKPFAGRIYAKGRAEIEECYKDDFARERTKKPHFDLKFGICGMRSLRSLFITKVDQAFHVKCFFEEASRGLTAELGVSMIPTTELEARHGIPGCSYSIHRSSIEELDEGKAAGPPIQFARVGDRVLHQWHCNDKMFGILINNCYVTDGFGKKADVINDKGCPVDPILITGIRYSADLQRAYAESSVFKFADKPGVWFFCQIQMCMKKAGMCQGISPPACATTAPAIESGEEAGGEAPEETEETKPSQVIEEVDYEETTPSKKTTTPSDYFESSDKRTTAEYSEYGEETNGLKLQSPSSSYATTTSSPEYDLQTEAMTIFGPGFASASSERGPPGGTRITTTSVSQSFDTEEDVGHSTSQTKKPSKVGKSDYNDYDDVTIPPNLTDLLANLPDDLSPETLQKMFRDSVDDRKALLEGFDILKKQLKKMGRRPSRAMRELRAGDLRSGDKIDQIQVDWVSARRRDVPTPTEPVRFNRPSSTTIDDGKPMIAGQLMIFELDEEPPDVDGRAQNGRASSFNSSCAISKGGLIAVAGGLGAVCAALFVAALSMFIKLNRLDEKAPDSISYGRYLDRFATTRRQS